MVSAKSKYKQERDEYWGSRKACEVVMFVPVGWDAITFYNREIQSAQQRARGLDKNIEKTGNKELKEYLMYERELAENTAGFWVELRNDFKEKYPLGDE